MTVGSPSQSGDGSWALSSEALTGLLTDGVSGGKIGTGGGAFCEEAVLFSTADFGVVSALSSILAGFSFSQLLAPPVGPNKLTNKPVAEHRTFHSALSAA